MLLTAILRLSKQDVTDLLTNMYFSVFNGQVFHQKESLSIGSSISGILAILFMDKLETIALSSQLPINPYKRYVDNIYLQTTSEEVADQFHHTMSNLHPKLKFKIEKLEITSSALGLLNFAKVTICKDGKCSFEFYKKKPKTHCSYTVNQLFTRNDPRSTSFVISGNLFKTDALHKLQTKTLRRV